MALSGLRKVVVPEFVYGSRARLLAGRYAANFGGRRALLVSDPGVVAAGWVDEVTQSIEEAGLQVVRFTAVSPNPRAEEVMAGVERHAAQRCDVVVAVGGGSPIDCAKGISVVAANGGHVLSFEGVDRIEAPGVPLICIPTTAGTSADVSQFAIITDQARRTKIAIISKSVVPDAALIDPDTTVTMNPWLTACTGLDALVHAIEAYLSVASSPMLDVHALEAMRLIRAHLFDARARPDDATARDGVMRASLHAGIAFSNASLGAVHAMSHSLGGYLDLAHGECNALLLEHVLAFNYVATPERCDRVGEAFGVPLSGLNAPQKRAAIVQAIIDFKAALNVTGGLAARGVTGASVSDLARNALNDTCMVTNPRRANRRDIEVIYEDAM